MLNKRISIMFAIAAIMVAGAMLLGSTSSQTPILENQSDPQMDADMTEQIRQMGGLRLVMPPAFAETDCSALADRVALADAGRDLVELNLTGESFQLPIMGGTTYNAMTFSGQVPGPTLRATQGDVVQMTLTIPDDEVTGHGIVMGTSQMDFIAYDSVNPGETSQYCYIAESAGLFGYHATGVHLIGMDQHVFSGMYGIAIVDPANVYGKLKVDKTSGSGELERQWYDNEALEFQLQYNQLYLNGDGNYDAGAMFQHHNYATVVNGIQFGYVPNEFYNLHFNDDADKNIFVAQPWNGLDLEHMQSQPLFVELGQPVRFFVYNQGNDLLEFSIFGEVLDKVVQGNRIQSYATPGWTIGGSQGAIIDVVFDNPGVYVAVNHNYDAMYTGAMSVIIAGDGLRLNPKLIDAGILTDAVPSYAHISGNPSDAVPPMGEYSIAHPAINIHGLYTDDVVSDKRDAGMIPLWEVMPTLPPVP